MANAITAGVIYAILVFLIGFILGVIRVLLIVPRLGEPAAVLIETPIILAVSWVICRWCVDWLDVRRRIGARSVMGVLAFVALLTARTIWAVRPIPPVVEPYVANCSTRDLPNA